MICSWKEFVQTSAPEVELTGGCDRRLAAGSGVPSIGNDNPPSQRQGAALRGGGAYGEQQFALALSLAKMLLATRGQFVSALCDASLARSRRERPDRLFFHAVEQGVNDALYAMARGGSATFEEILRRVIEDIASEALNERSDASDPTE